ncbi:transcription factor A, mitochondrial isoform X2 [Rhipicephalus microplus]|uniref:transcription factor A, mitochondrial isoform X2 n=1 Tax=Rhipicephalus microplus TaxID=6941 RepID=UPI0018896109|nr:transcription factor A, mitochondrial-like isoform X2 [Rhipicephalus microplus]
MALSMSAVLKGFFSNKHIIGRSIGATSCCARLTQNSARGFATQKHSSTGTVPPVPKRPPSGFILFAADARKIVLKENPALTATEVIKAVAGKWKTADDNTRNKYAALARERFEQYQKEKAAYDSQLTEQQKEALEDVRLDKKLKLTKRKLNDKLKELDKPKGARSAYVLFSTEMRKKLQEKPPKEMMTQLGAMWKQLPEEKKQAYVHKADEDRIRYEQEMKIWSNRLEKEGQSDVLNDLREDLREIRRSKHGSARKTVA